MPDGTLVWVYGVVWAESPAPARTGLDGRGVRPVRAGRLAALVSDVPEAEFSGPALTARLEDLDAVGAMSRAHDGVLEDALVHGDVLPFRLCTIYESDAAVARMLTIREPTFATILERLAGKVEWGVKVFNERPAVAASPTRPAAASGTEYLARRLSARNDAELERQALEETLTGVHARLAQGAAAAVVGRPQDRRLSGRDAEMVLNGAYLVERDRARAFAVAVDELRATHASDGLILELTGPWPPYSFVADPS